MARGHRRTVWIAVSDEALRLRAYGRKSVHKNGIKRQLIDAADRAMQLATTEELQAYKLRYVDGMSYMMASQKMFISESSFYRVLRGLLQKVEKEIA